MEDVETRLEISKIQIGATRHSTATYTKFTVLLVAVIAITWVSKRTTT